MPKKYIDAVCVGSEKIHNNFYIFVWDILITAFMCKVSKSNRKVYFLLNPGGFSGGLSFKSWIKQLVIILQYSVLYILGVRIIRLGASFGPFSKGRAYIERLKNKFIYWNSARDSDSVSYGIENGLVNMHFFPDLAFLTKPVASGDSYISKEYFLMSFRCEESESYNLNLKEVVAKISSAAYSENFGKCVFTSQVLFDVEWNIQLVELVKRNNIEACYENCSEDELMGVYSGALAVFSNRLHVLLFAMRQGAKVFPVVDIYKNKKIVGIFKDIGLSDMIIDINKPFDGIPNVSPGYYDIVKTIFNRNSVSAVSTFEGILSS